MLGMYRNKLGAGTGRGGHHVGGQHFDAGHVGLYFLIMHLFAGLFASRI